MSNGLEHYMQKYSEYDVEQLRAMLTNNASPEAVELAALPWKSHREVLEDLNTRTQNALDRLMSGWEGEAADLFLERVGKLAEFNRILAVYDQNIEQELIPQLAGALKEAQSEAETVRGEASEMSFEEWSESRRPWEMNDRVHYENAQKNERLQMAAIVAKLADQYAKAEDGFKKNPPPTPATDMPGANANPPSGPLFDEPPMAPGMTNDGTPHAPATASTGAPGSSGGADINSDGPATPATENPWGIGDGEGEEVGEGLYAATGGAGLGGSTVAPTTAAAPTGGAGVGAMGAGAAGLGIAGAGAAGASGSGVAGKPGSGAGPARAGGPGGTMRPGQAPGTNVMGGGPKGGPGGAAGAKGGAGAGRPGGAAMAGGGRPGEDSEEEAAEDGNWLKESENYFSHFDPNAGPSDEYDPKAVREWERMYDRWKDMKETGEI